MSSEYRYTSPEDITTETARIERIEVRPHDAYQGSLVGPQRSGVVIYTIVFGTGQGGSFVQNGRSPIVGRVWLADVPAGPQATIDSIETQVLAYASNTGQLPDGTTVDI